MLEVKSDTRHPVEAALDACISFWEDVDGAPERFPIERSEIIKASRETAALYLSDEVDPHTAELVAHGAYLIASRGANRSSTFNDALLELSVDRSTPLEKFDENFGADCSDSAKHILYKLAQLVVTAT